MTAERTTDEALLAALLRRSETLPDAPQHVDDELLAMFAVGQLTAAELERVVEHLADCSLCRETASRLIVSADIDAGEAAEVSRPVAWRQRAPSRTWTMAVAAALLVGVSLTLLWPAIEPHSMAERRTYGEAVAALQAGHFDEVRELMAAAAERGVRSPRLINLEAQAIREISSPVALASSATLTDFGVSIGGVVARGDPSNDQRRQLEEAAKLLTAAGTTDPVLELNRGHLLLSQNRTEEALEVFRRLTDEDDSQNLAWLGRGLAEYLGGDYTAAEASFLRALSGADDATRVAIQLNLAITLTDAGRLREALDAWRQLMANPEATRQLPAETRTEIEQEIDAIERQLSQ